MPLHQVARTLGVHLKRVSYHWCGLQKQIAANAPRSPDDFAVLRERIAAMLWDTIALTIPPTQSSSSSNSITSRNSETPAHSPATTEIVPIAPSGLIQHQASSPPAQLAIRLKALEQLARLYDLGLDSRAPGCIPHAYLTPDEVGELARDRILDLHTDKPQPPIQAPTWDLA